MVGYIAQFFSIIFSIFDVTVPGFAPLTFKQLLFGFFMISVLISCFKLLLGLTGGGGVSYRVGRPKKSGKGEEQSDG